MHRNSHQKILCGFSVDSLWPHGLPAFQASSSLTISRSLLQFMSTESVMPSNHLILCCPLLLLPSVFPSIRVFSNESALASGGQSIGDSASASILPMNICCWFSLGLTGLISLQSKGFSRVFSSTTIQKHQFFSTQPSLWSNSYIHTWLLKKHSFDCRDLWWQSDVSAFEYSVYVHHSFSPKDQVSFNFVAAVTNQWLLEPRKIKSVAASTFSPSVSHEAMGLDAMILVFRTLSFKPTFPLSSFTLTTL